jgi:hypothetical protein
MPHGRARIELRARVRPTGAQQCFVRERALEADTTQGARRVVERLRLEEQRAENQVRLVDDGERLCVAALQRSGAVELQDGFLLLALL